MSDENVVARYTISAVPRNGGGQPHVFKVKSPGNPTPPPPEPQPPAGTLLEKLTASFCLPDSVPNPGCEAGQEQHDRWIQWLANAFPQPLFANDIEGAIACLQGGQTTCSHVLNVAFRHFGIPSKYTGGDTHNTVVPMSCKSPYVKKVTPDSLPRLGDPYYIASPKEAWTHAHHAIFGGSASQSPPQVGSYSGGWAPPHAPMSTPDAGPYRSPSPLAQDASGNTILIGAPADAHGLGGNQKKIWWYTDMWAFFRDHSAEIKPLRDGLK